MADRQIELKHLGGYKDQLYETVVGADAARDDVPDAQTLERIKEAGKRYMRRTSELFRGNVLPYTTVVWPDVGPVIFGMVFAYNERHPIDPETGEEGFFRQFTETHEAIRSVVTWDDALEQLQRYGVAHFGKPTAVD